MRLWHISIHAPREGGDVLPSHQKPRDHISIHAPREGGDIRRIWTHSTDIGFQSTPPARGATIIIAIGVPKLFYISIHAPREGGDALEAVHDED